jgi:hypothetical protein
MHDLIGFSIEAHGGLARWNQLRQISASFIPGGLSFKQRGQEAFTRERTRVTVDTREQRAVYVPFLGSGQSAIFEPKRTAIAASDGTILEELNNPRDSFRDMGTPWSATQLAYFAGYAMWMYLTMPFSLVGDGIETEEIGSWAEDGETWRALKLKFPKSFVTHSTEQTLYFDSNGLIRRHDYAVEIFGGRKATHYRYDHRATEGITFSHKRRVYLPDAEGRPKMDTVMISIDLDELELLRVAP